MIFCKNCGAMLPDDANFCTDCGTKVANSENTGSNNRQNDGHGANNGTYNSYGYAPINQGTLYKQIPQKPVNIPLLVFSIINIFISGFIGLWPLFVTLGARNAKTDEETKRKLQFSLIINIVVAAFGILLNIIILSSAGGLLSGGGSETLSIFSSLFSLLKM